VNAWSGGHAALDEELDLGVLSAERVALPLPIGEEQREAGEQFVGRGDEDDSDDT
jgi:hypothetical protein